MKQSLRHGLVARCLAAGILGSMVVQLAAATAVDDSDAMRHRELALPATTACLEAQLASGRAQNTLSGIAVAAVLDGRVVYRRGFGTVSPSSTQPVQSSTRFRIGSVTKVLTATALLSLVDDDRLRLHAPVTRLLPGLSLPGDPAWMDLLTAHRLLSNQGGIADPSDGMGPSDDGALAAAFYDPAFTETAGLTVRPGTFYNYSSTNFALAGLLTEAATGKPYRTVVRQRVFEPLEMKRATFLSSDVMADNDAAAGVTPETVYPPGAYDDSIERPAGLAWASADDMAKFMKFILRGSRDVLSTRQWRAMQTAQVDTAERPHAPIAYGYGLAVDPNGAFPDSGGQLRFYPGVKRVWHEGAVHGYRALMVTLPNQQFGYVALVNGDLRSSFTDSVPCMRVAAAEVIGSRLPAPAPFPVPVIERSRFVDYVGDYVDWQGVTATVALTASGDLRIQIPVFDAQEYPYDPILRPSSLDNFALELAPGDGSLLVTGFRQSGSEVVYLRTRETVLVRTTAATSVASVSAASRGAAAPVVDDATLIQAWRAAAREQGAVAGE